MATEAIRSVTRSLFFCIRTESAGSLTSYDVAIERRVLEPHGVQVLPLDIDEPAAFAALAPRADAVLHFRGILDEPRIAFLQRCRIIAHYGTGLDRVDIEAASARGIWVTSGPLYAVDEVSSHAIALLLAVARKIVAADRAVREGRWHIPPLRPIYRIAGKVLGILGFGNIARATARKGQSLGLEVIAADPYVDAAVFTAHNVRRVTFEQCLMLADYLSIHLPLTAETKGMVGPEALARMKPSALLINTSRGAVVDEPALVEALGSGRLAGAGLDVFAEEPLSADNPLLELPNVTLSGHVAFYSEESIEQMQREAAEQVLAVLQGRVPSYLVNLHVPAPGEAAARP